MDVTPGWLFRGSRLPAFSPAHLGWADTCRCYVRGVLPAGAAEGFTFTVSLRSM